MQIEQLGDFAEIVVLVAFGENLKQTKLKEMAERRGKYLARHRHSVKDVPQHDAHDLLALQVEHHALTVIVARLRLFQ